MGLGGIGTTVLLALLPRGSESQTPQTGFLDRRVTVAGRSYHYQVFVPFSYNPSQRWPVILFLHGGGEGGDDGLLPTQVGLGAAVGGTPAVPRRSPSSPTHLLRPLRCAR